MSLDHALSSPKKEKEEHYILDFTYVTFSISLRENQRAD